MTDTVAIAYKFFVWIPDSGINHSVIFLDHPLFLNTTRSLQVSIHDDRYWI